MSLITPLKCCCVIYVSRELSRRSKDGNTALHLCAELDKPECMKLLLRSLPELVNFENYSRQTPLEIAKSKKHELCVDLVRCLALYLQCVGELVIAVRRYMARGTFSRLLPCSVQFFNSSKVFNVT
jgi:ankyrin repeat protein